MIRQYFLKPGPIPSSAKHDPIWQYDLYHLVSKACPVPAWQYELCHPVSKLDMIKSGNMTKACHVPAWLV
ncbi:hypothetical protein CHS0354_007037 [Potamilus streckersoni]|uniref:Uncharacterized protein n=1 Tax=Potamilus streckersoni TaxID=2493646 RepID=A0AAE0SBL3_9BIVA|nr:hypothetical protein CHS0354_007037 [Potamilus streckersoni]